MSDQPQDRMPSEEEMRAYEEQIKQMRVEDVLVQTLVSLLNLGGRKAGLASGTEDERDLEQLHLAVEGVRSLLPLIEPQLGPDAKTLRDALSQLQLAYAQLSGAAPGGGAAGGEGPPSGQAPGGERPGQPGASAPSSGRLWVPGQ